MTRANDGLQRAIDVLRQHDEALVQEQLLTPIHWHRLSLLRAHVSYAIGVLTAQQRIDVNTLRCTVDNTGNATSIWSTGGR